MVALSFLTPYAAVVGLAAAVPLAMLVVGARRSGRAAAALGLHPAAARRAAAAAAIAALGVLVSVAAAQPVLQAESARLVRQDAETYFVVDTSRSMLAARSAMEETRFDRARRAARRLRDELGDVPAGIASMTDRVVPHLLATPSREAFAATVQRAVAVDRPPPIERSSTRSTSLGAVAALARQRFFTPAARRRLVIVLSDAESRRFAVDEAARRFTRERYLLLLIRFWRDDERVWTASGAEPYLPDAAAAQITERFIAAAGGRIFHEDEVGAAAAAARQFLGDGPKIAQGTESRPVSLAPWVLAAGVLPLGLLIWRRPLRD